MSKIATWNVNSVKVRMPHLTEWLGTFQPDILMLQEIKCTSSEFPAMELKALGYHVNCVGQKTYNGVALLSKLPATDLVEALPGDDGDSQARYLEATVGDLRVASIYLPNGNPVDTDKFTYKLAWLDRLGRHARSLLASERKVVLAGDFNVCPTDIDVYDPVAFSNDALCRAESRSRFRALINQGYTDAFRALFPRSHAYSFWDYQGGAWQRDLGLRIDHLLLSPQAADRLVAVGIDRKPRDKEKASDHTPVWCELSD